MIDKIIGSVILLFLVLFFVVGAIGSLISSISTLIDPELIALLCIVGLTIPLLFFFGISVSTIRKSFIRAKLLDADKNGIFPVILGNDPINDHLFNVALAAHNAKKVDVPHSFTYAPRMTKNGSHDNIVDEEKISLHIPEFRSLPFNQNKILVGYEEKDPFYVPTEKMISTLVGGVSGSGKTTLMRLLVSQFLMQGYKLSIIDPHLEAGEESLAHSFISLENYFFSPIVSRETSSTIHDTLSLFDSEILARLTGKTDDRSPLLLIIDEFTSLIADSQYKNHVVETITKIASESRKVNICAFCLTQQARKETLPVFLRNSFSNIIATKMRQDSAYLLSGSNDFAKAVNEIRGYQSVYMNLSQLSRLNTPNCTINDIVSITEVTRPSFHLPKASISRPTIDTVEGERRPERRSEESQKKIDSRDLLVLSHLKLGDKFSDIISDIYGVKSKGGASYNTAMADIQRIIRENL